MVGNHLSPDTPVRLAPGVRTRLDSSGHVLLDAPDGTIVDIGPLGFATLSMFARPLSLRAATERLENGSTDATDFVPTLSVINMLIEEGALAPTDADGGRRGGGPIRSSTRACSTTIAGRMTTSPRYARR